MPQLYTITWFGFFAWLMLFDPMLSTKCFGVCFATSDILLLMTEILAPRIKLTIVLRFVSSPFRMWGSMFLRIEPPKTKFWNCCTRPGSLGSFLSWCVVRLVGEDVWGSPVEHAFLVWFRGWCLGSLGRCRLDWWCYWSLHLQWGLRYGKIY